MVPRLVDFLRREEGSSAGLAWALVAQVLVLGSVAVLLAIRHALHAGG
jgi:hypothetical protein